MRIEKMKRTILCLAVGLASIACDGDSTMDAAVGDSGAGDTGAADTLPGDTGASDTGGAPPGTVEDPVAACDATAFGVCTDYAGDAAMFELGCSASGTWSTSEFCDPAGSCGSCTVDVGDYQATTYYYPGSGPESMSAEVCGNGMGVWRDVPSVSCD